MESFDSGCVDVSITLQEGTYVSRFFLIVQVQKNILGCLIQDVAEPDASRSFRIVYRYRYIVDDKTTADSEDVKKWYEVRLRDERLDEARGLAILDDLLVELKLKHTDEDSETHVIVVESDSLDVVRSRLAGLPIHTTPYH
jgi:hypothetical protein